MSEMRFTCLVRNARGVMEKRKVGFNSREVFYYEQTNDPEVTAVVLVKQGVKEIVFVTVPPSEFYQEKERAEKQDIYLYSDN